jgi:hypothetical protein
MTKNSTPLDLCGKACEAVAAYIKSNTFFRQIDVVTQTTEEPLKNGAIVVSARRGAMVGGQNSGIWQVVVTLEMKLERRANSTTDTLFQKRCAALASLFEKDFKSTAEKITSCSPGEFYCYFVQFEGDDKTPLDDKHRYEITLNMEAMPVAYNTALKNMVIDKFP